MGEMNTAVCFIFHDAVGLALHMNGRSLVFTDEMYTASFVLRVKQFYALQYEFDLVMLY